MEFALMAPYRPQPSSDVMRGNGKKSVERMTREGERKCRQIYFILFVLVFSQDKVYLWSLNRRQYGNEFNIICAATLFILSA